MRSDLAEFGGLSGAWLNPDGRALTLVSDRGGFFELRLRRDRTGKLAGADLVRHGRLVGTNGKPLRGRYADSEELSRTAQGFLVAFEHFHRVQLYRNGLERPPDALRLPPEILALPDNSGIEGMAVLPDGRIVLIAEALEEGRVAVWTGRSGSWGRSAYMPRAGYRPTGAVALPDGSVLVTERRFAWLGGFAAVLARAVPPADGSGNWQRTELLDLPLAPLAENFEAVAAWRDGQGRMRAYLVSDDNFSPFQASLLLEVELPGNRP